MLALDLYNANGTAPFGYEKVDMKNKLEQAVALIRQGQPQKALLILAKVIQDLGMKDLNYSPVLTDECRCSLFASTRLLATQCLQTYILSTIPIPSG